MAIKKQKAKLSWKERLSFFGNNREKLFKVLFAILLAILSIILLSSIICRWPFEEKIKYRTVLDIIFSLLIPIVLSAYIKVTKKLNKKWVYHCSSLLILIAVVGNFYYQKLQIVTINVVGNSHDALEKEIRMFNRVQAEKGGKIRAELLRDWSGYYNTNKRWEKAFDYLQDGSYNIDVIEVDGIWINDILNLPKGSRLHPLDKLYSAEFLSNRRFIPKALEVGKHGVHQYAIPFYIDVGLFFYRKDLFKGNINPPSNLIEFKDFIISGLGGRSCGYEGFVFQGGPYEGLICSFLELLRINEGYLEYRNNRINLNNEKVIETINFMREGIFSSKIIPPSVFGYEEGESMDSFCEGHSIMLRNWPFIIQVCQDNPDSESCKNIALLEIEKAKPILGGWYLAIPEKSKYKKQAWELIKYLTTTNNQRIRSTQYKSSNRMPPDYDALKMLEEECASCTWIKHIRKAIEKARPRPKMPNYMEFSKEFSKTLFRVLSNPNINIECIREELLRCENKINQ
jgi:multiple sugar transport system substrate-binding protein